LIRTHDVTAKEMFELMDAGLIPEKIELIDGRLRTTGDEEYPFTPAQARTAAALGIRVRNVVDAVLEDPEALAEIVRRLGESTAGRRQPEVADEIRRLAADPADTAERRAGMTTWTRHPPPRGRVTPSQPGPEQPKRWTIDLAGAGVGHRAVPLAQAGSRECRGGPRRPRVPCRERRREGFTRATSSMTATARSAKSAASRLEEGLDIARQVAPTRVPRAR
jgi:hypothetical protein